MTARLLVPLVVVLVSGLASTGSAVAVDDHAGGMCQGRTDADVEVNARAVGRPGDVPKYILNLATDDAGHPSGVLILERGRDRLLVEDWCRLWRHLPGQEHGACDEGSEEAATIVHAVGTGRLRDGTSVRVRTDARATEEGMFFRIRYRPLGAGHDEPAVTAAEDHEGCEDDGWVRVPAEGWYPLDDLKVRIGGL